MNLSEDLRKIFLAGVGAIATTAERSQEMIEKLVKKGELSVEQGKSLNQELKHNFSSSVSDSTNTMKKSAVKTASSIFEGIEQLSANERMRLKEMLENLESDQDNAKKEKNEA